MMQTTRLTIPFIALGVCAGLSGAPRSPRISPGIYRVAADGSAPTKHAYGTLDNRIFGVFDGHRGGSVATHAAARLPNRIESGMSQAETSRDVRKAIVRAFRREDRVLQRKKSYQSGAGTFGAVVLHQGKDVYIAHIGSTRAFVILKHKGRIWSSRNHVLGNSAERDRVRGERGYVWTDAKNRNSIIAKRGKTDCRSYRCTTRALGDFYQSKSGELRKPRGLAAIPDIRKFHAKNVRAIFVLTESVWTVMDQDALKKKFKELLSSQEPTERWAQNIVEASREAARQKHAKVHDMTALVIRFE
ncbi:MAG: protein phosphatase 2C domain-containing protein [Candidatus Dependentiae bacterium]|nr:protein phosphatase 2C domain-containing protein [Candidatus Dependentiae bacterium]